MSFTISTNTECRKSASKCGNFLKTPFSAPQGRIKGSKKKGQDTFDQVWVGFSGQIDLEIGAPDDPILRTSCAKLKKKKYRLFTPFDSRGGFVQKELIGTELRCNICWVLLVCLFFLNFLF